MSVRVPTSTISNPLPDEDSFRCRNQFWTQGGRQVCDRILLRAVRGPQRRRDSEGKNERFPGNPPRSLRLRGTTSVAFWTGIPRHQIPENRVIFLQQKISVFHLELSRKRVGRAPLLRQLARFELFHLSASHSQLVLQL